MQSERAIIKSGLETCLSIIVTTRLWMRTYASSIPFDNLYGSMQVFIDIHTEPVVSSNPRDLTGLSDL